MKNRYHEITKLFNCKKKRVVIASGQAVVLHRLAIMSKDCDWIIREDEESFRHVITVLSQLGACYRFGAPLSLPWHRHGWSSHFEVLSPEHRLRLDFFSRPPRLTAQDLDHIWRSAESQELPFVGKMALIKQKLTDRLKDYAIIGEIVRTLTDEAAILSFSQSARDLLELLGQKPELKSSLIKYRPQLASIDLTSNEAELEIRLALERERYEQMQENLRRINSYREASTAWAKLWPKLEKQIRNVNLLQAHEILIKEAENVLPKEVVTKEVGTV